ncbi:hypothetical protein [Rhizobium tumorigenes]|uniref:Uncharacterized protein n=1 Tax=Rhizobium tumorigenes TaxID=2041385 RepID=A0AAF1KWI6_9HYPH|nr:hypothetical protein [Rhizobium tumorigenes]WFR98726.1 hypothetical protein PR017_23790 [Rhizobium tumorigenes]
MNNGRSSSTTTDIARQDGAVVEYQPPPPPPAIPLQISDRQFFQQLSIEGLITEDEALDAVGPGIIPSSMLALINMLPMENQFAAKMLIRGATTFERLHPVTVLIQQLYEWNDAKRDEFWTAAAAL